MDLELWGKEGEYMTEKEAAVCLGSREKRGLTGAIEKTLSSELRASQSQGLDSNLAMKGQVKMSRICS